MSPAGVNQVAPAVRSSGDHFDASGEFPHATSLTSVPSSVCQAKPAVVAGSALPGAPTATFPPSPRRTRTMFGFEATSVFPADQSLYSTRGATLNEQPFG